MVPERSVVTYRAAGLGSRILAHFVDILLVVALLYGGSMVSGYLLARLDEGVAGAALAVASVSVPFLYFILSEGLFNGRTPGKRAAGIRVRMRDGTPVTFTAAVGRNLLRMADLLPGTYFVGLVSIFLNPNGQRIGDLVAGTVVVAEERVAGIVATAPHLAGIHPLESLVGDLRGMTDGEYQALKRFADRFPELPGPARQRLVDEVYLPIATRLDVPAPPDVHPIYLAEAMVMKHGRKKGYV